MFDLEQIYGIILDGIGATIKNGLKRLILADKVHLRSACEAYLAAAKHHSDVGKLAHIRVQLFMCQLPE